MSDVRAFLLHRPAIPTLIHFQSDADRASYGQRIAQRLGISVTEYSVLNLHHIEIDAPVRYVFEELLQWDGDSTCWPNHVAKVERVGGRIEQIRILLLGRGPRTTSRWERFIGRPWPPLFCLQAVSIQSVPDAYFDNARYLLYRCTGGYPVGFFGLYVRSPIAERGETMRTQMFVVVGFNFFGRTSLRGSRLMRMAWEAVHNRVTANVMNRLKHLCEWRFRQLQSGSSTRP